MIKIKWQVSIRPSGRYRSFEQRSWPTAEYKDGRICAAIYCDDEYCPRNVRKGNHKVLTLKIADYSKNPFRWKVATKRFITLEAAKEGLVILLKANPHLTGE